MMQSLSFNQLDKIDKFDEDFAFLSNFYPSPIKDGDLTYPTVEHYFQAMKTTDKYGRRLVAVASTPGKAKRIGRNLRLRRDWEDIKYDVMKEAIHMKFQDVELRKKLKATGDAYLEEGNTWHDNIWGNCHCEKCKDIQGTNWLGTILMEERKNCQ